MKKLLLLLFLLLIPFLSFSQDYGNNIDAIEICAAMQSNNFSSDTKAENALDQILNVIGASKRFVLQPCDNINNAVATSFKGIRYILYDRDFMDSLDNSNNWGNLFILAHEVGHHINGHSVDIILYAADIVEPKTLEQKRQQELEADEFAGFILAKLGGDISEANKIILKATTNDDDSYSTHPSGDKRLNAIKIGYNKGLGNKTTVYEAPKAAQTAEEYFYRAYEKANKNDKRGAIADYTKAIALDPNFVVAYFNRGSAKFYLEDYYGAIADFTKVIVLDPNDVDAYYFRGLVKRNLGDYNGAMADYNKAIALDPNFVVAYFNRGSAKNDLEDYEGAISDFTKAIVLDPNYVDAHYNRGSVKYYLEDYYGAIADFTKAIVLDPNDDDAYNNRGLAKDNLEDYKGAIEDYNKAIDINPNDAVAYANRGVSKENLGDLSGACGDWKKAANLGYIDAAEWLENQCN